MLCNKSIREDIGWQSHIQTAVPHFVSGHRHPEILNSFVEETLEVLYPQLARAGVTRDEVRRYLEVAKIIFGTNSIWDNSKAKVHMEAANYGLV